MVKNTQLHLCMKGTIFVSVFQPARGTEWVCSGWWSYASEKTRSESGASSFCPALSTSVRWWLREELGSMSKWMCQLLFSVEGSALLVWIFIAVCETPVHSIMSDYNQPEICGVCFQVFVFLCHLKKYNGVRLSIEIQVRKLKDTVPSVTMYHPDCS